MTLDPELSKSLNELAIMLISGITTIFLPWAFSIARAYAKAKIEHVTNNETRAALEFALDRLDATAQTVVNELSQKVKAIKTDGKLAPEQAKELLTIAFKRVSSRLPADAAATLKSSYGDKLQAVLVGKIESKVAESK
jgi:hypothetical protein